MDPIRWTGKSLEILDQTLLPDRVEWIECRSYDQVAEAIVNMRVRGAPLIGIVAAYGVCLAALGYSGPREEEMAYIQEAITTLANTRPTAVNLFWSLERMRQVLQGHTAQDGQELASRLVQEANRIWQEDLEASRRMGELGADLLPPRCRVLTHCNAGALATSGYGTALGVIRAGFRKGKIQRVFADETRPLLQGARLTAWELSEDGIPVTVITDGAACHLMGLGQVDVVIVGADRVAANGDVANKIGTYGLAVAAHYHQLPFYVVCPLSTIDLATGCGQDITIEQRDEGEVRAIGNKLLVAPKAGVYNPAFDVTPAHLITAIITERGVAKPPYEVSLAGLMQKRPGESAGERIG